MLFFFFCGPWSGKLIKVFLRVEELVTICYLCVRVGCVVCLSPNDVEKLQAVSPLGLCPSQWLSGKSQTVLSMSSTVQNGRLAWAKEAAFELKMLVCACWRTSVSPRKVMLWKKQINARIWPTSPWKRPTIYIVCVIKKAFISQSGNTTHCIIVTLSFPHFIWFMSANTFICSKFDHLFFSW